MTEAAFDNRLLRFKEKWIPKWQQYKRDRLWALVALVVAAATAALLWWLLGAKKAADTIGPAPGPVLRPAPTATASAVEDERLNQAAPTDAGREKPERLKP